MLLLIPSIKKLMELIITCQKAFILIQQKFHSYFMIDFFHFYIEFFYFVFHCGYLRGIFFHILLHGFYFSALFLDRLVQLCYFNIGLYNFLFNSFQFSLLNFNVITQTGKTEIFNCKLMNNFNHQVSYLNKWIRRLGL